MLRETRLSASFASFRMMFVYERVRCFFEYLIEVVFGWFCAQHQPIPPPHEDVLQMGAVDIAAGIRTHQFSAEYVMKAYIDRIKTVNPMLNAMVDFRFEQAMAEARRVDEMLATLSDEELASKPFLGVPFTSKESTHCEGMACTFALKSRVGVKADGDASVIRKMKAAGAILIGVTNVPQLNLWTETTNPVYGITRNPYNTARTVGGSSGGEAALLAACATPFGVGTDIGGSIRLPSYMCGIFGHKPSAGLTDTVGLTFRDGTNMDKTMVVVGPMSRSVGDLIPGLKVLLGPRASALQLDTPVDVSSLHYYVVHKNNDILCSPIRAEVSETMEMVISHLRDLSKRDVTQLDHPHWRHGLKIFKQLLLEEKGDFAVDVTNRTGKASGLRELLRYLTLSSDFSLHTICNLLLRDWAPLPNKEWVYATLEELRTALIETLADNGVLIYHSWPQTATYHHVSYTRPANFAYMCVFNALKFPVTQVPMGLSADGLPLGVQVVAAPYQDRLCIAVAKELGRVFGGYKLPPVPV